MLRRLFIGFFLLTSLTGQVGTAFACAMTGEVTMHRCCPGQGTASRPAHDNCCQQVVVAAIDPGAASALSRAVLPDVPAPMAIAMLPCATGFTMAAAPCRPPPQASPASGRLTYLHTQRLRI